MNDDNIVDLNQQKVAIIDLDQKERQRIHADLLGVMVRGANRIGPEAMTSAALRALLDLLDRAGEADSRQYVANRLSRFR